MQLQTLFQSSHFPCHQRTVEKSDPQSPQPPPRSALPFDDSAALVRKQPAVQEIPLWTKTQHWQATSSRAQRAQRLQGCVSPNGEHVPRRVFDEPKSLAHPETRPNPAEKQRLSDNGLQDHSTLQSAESFQDQSAHHYSIASTAADWARDAETRLPVGLMNHQSPVVLQAVHTR